MSDDNHDRAIAQSLAWAQAAADRGDFEEACVWLETVLATDGRLPDGWEGRAEEWRARARANGD